MKGRKKIFILVADLVTAAALVTGVWGVNYLIPQTGIKTQTMAEVSSQAGEGQAKLSDPVQREKRLQSRVK
ncbi:MAG TPA: hypothetical protein H9873_09320 [Candidatus Dorea gallistercoris]|uniref:Uncharacterized protein n=1 Tax=Candidatus Dorea gallistercoris TaxID=2838542 RepID=A0A9D1UFG1_9FIRM|nr:hypothetical protein [Candidatus Dorea gallistercoris]